MITRTKHIVDLDLIEEATQAFKTNDFKTTLNEPTGSFFYDGWKIKDKYKNTVWEKLLNTLAIGNYGEARVIKLDIERCYTAHADIDDRHTDICPITQNDCVWGGGGGAQWFY